MIGKKLEEAFNKQINAETYSAYLYWSMAAYFDSVDLPGFANWMRVQGQEEMAHAAKFYDSIRDRGGRVKLTAIEAPKTEWSSPLEAFKDAYKHEQKVTGLMNNLVDLAGQEKDHAASNFLQWFVAEQVEEEANADQIVKKLERIGNGPGPLLMLDRDLGDRSAGGAGESDD